MTAAAAALSASPRLPPRAGSPCTQQRSITRWWGRSAGLASSPVPKRTRPVEYAPGVTVNSMPTKRMWWAPAAGRQHDRVAVTRAIEHRLQVAPGGDGEDAAAEGRGPGIDDLVRRLGAGRTSVPGMTVRAGGRDHDEGDEAQGEPSRGPHARTS